MGRRRVAKELREWIEIVVEDNADDLLRYLRRRVNHPEDAADLLGRVLLTLWENGAKVPTTDEEARMWSFGIARNVVREHYRRNVRRLELADRLRFRLSTSTQSASATDGLAEANIRNAELRRAVMALDESSRELVMLVHWDGFSIASAARLLSINDSTARTRYGRALRRLERELHNRPSFHEADRPTFAV